MVIEILVMDCEFGNYTNEELFNRLQELMEVPLPEKDASFFNSDEKLLCNTLRTPALKDIRNITLSLSLGHPSV